MVPTMTPMTSGEERLKQGGEVIHGVATSWS